MGKPQCPKDCVDRTPGCHATCKKYLKQRRRRDAELAWLRAKKDETSFDMDVKHNGIRNGRKFPTKWGR
jgi:hypothetical protein